MPLCLHLQRSRSGSGMNSRRTSGVSLLSSGSGGAAAAAAAGAMTALMSDDAAATAAAYSPAPASPVAHSAAEASASSVSLVPAARTTSPTNVNVHAAGTGLLSLPSTASVGGVHLGMSAAGPATVSTTGVTMSRFMAGDLSGAAESKAFPRSLSPRHEAASISTGTVSTSAATVRVTANHRVESDTASLAADRARATQPVIMVVSTTALTARLAEAAVLPGPGGSFPTPQRSKPPAAAVVSTSAATARRQAALLNAEASLAADRARADTASLTAASAASAAKLPTIATSAVVLAAARTLTEEQRLGRCGRLCRALCLNWNGRRTQLRSQNASLVGSAVPDAARLGVALSHNGGAAGASSSSGNLSRQSSAAVDDALVCSPAWWCTLRTALLSGFCARLMTRKAQVGGSGIWTAAFHASEYPVPSDLHFHAQMYALPAWAIHSSLVWAASSVMFAFYLTPDAGIAEGEIHHTLVINRLRTTLLLTQVLSVPQCVIL
jgi:hypothetical protein